MTSLDTTVNLPEDVLFHEVEDEMVLLNLANGRYFSLDDVGTRMWLLIAEHKQLRAVHEALLKEYAVEPAQLEQDLLTLTDKLIDDGLLQVADA